MFTRRLIAGVLLLPAAWFSMISAACGQSSATGASGPKGFTWDEYVSGSSSTLGQVMKLDTTIGHNFNRYWGVDVGLPVYFVRASATSAANGFTSGTGLGNAYVDLRLTVDNPVLNFASVLTGTAPTGNKADGFSTGRATFDWDNHFDRDFGPLRPFLDLGVANSISDTHFFVRPFTTLGLVSHFEGGATYGILPFVRAGASLYDDLPAGQQKVFSKLIGRRPGVSVSRGRSRRGSGPFESAAETIGPAAIARDNGFAIWGESASLPVIDLQAGYSRSVHYALNTVFFGVGFHLGGLIHKATGH
jgi:hypothetical protein